MRSLTPAIVEGTGAAARPLARGHRARSRIAVALAAAGGAALSLALAGGVAHCLHGRRPRGDTTTSTDRVAAAAGRTRALEPGQGADRGRCPGRRPADRPGGPGTPSPWSGGAGRPGQQPATNARRGQPSPKDHHPGDARRAPTGWRAAGTGLPAAVPGRAGFVYVVVRRLATRHDLGLVFGRAQPATALPVQSAINGARCNVRSNASGCRHGGHRPRRAVPHSEHRWTPRRTRCNVSNKLHPARSR